MRRALIVMGVMVPLGVMLRAVGPAPLFALLPAVPMAIMGYLRYQDMRRQQRENSCPTCELRLAYRRLGASHGMLECPAMCGYRRLVGDPTAR
ncbi:MAG: hypothetical protein M3O23_09875 [Actinomycetota bacterium]|nr:hypothetical protein [Actinomycetota bacterium]